MLLVQRTQSTWRAVLLRAGPPPCLGLQEADARAGEPWARGRRPCSVQHTGVRPTPASSRCGCVDHRRRNMGVQPLQVGSADIALQVPAKLPRGGVSFVRPADPDHESVLPLLRRTCRIRSGAALLRPLRGREPARRRLLHELRRSVAAHLTSGRPTASHPTRVRPTASFRHSREACPRPRSGSGSPERGAADSLSRNSARARTLSTSSSSQSPASGLGSSLIWV